jgi:deoxyadenosine/deoxycytidine kinase
VFDGAKIILKQYINIMVKPRFISIEGNIGSGKSTLLNKLKAENPTWYFVDEPVSRWLSTKEGDKSLIELFYENRPKWAYNFQSFALLTRLQNINAAYMKAKEDGRENPIIVMERSLETDSNIFAKMLHDTGDMLDIEWTIYNEWFSEFTKLNSVSDRAVIWVDTPVDICIERIHGRGRQGEDKIEASYLASLDKYHREWLDNEKVIEVLKVINWGDSQTNQDDIMRFIYFGK